MRRILILGGTGDARALAARFAKSDGFEITLSLAGRTSDPLPHAVPVITGGFGGADGLADYVLQQEIDLLVDATHPFAERMSGNAANAALRTGIPLLALRRPTWGRQEGDRWTPVRDAAEAVAALGTAPRRVFLSLGRQEVGPFAAAPQHFYLIRSVEPVDLDVPNARHLLARGPFAEADERALLIEWRINVVVSKNSGGDATYGKIAAARDLGIEVLMLERPNLPLVDAVASVDAAERRIHQLLSRA
ncbi:MAG: cobalt-precorrin-6A reductase [Rhizobiaceae bacterium]